MTLVDKHPLSEAAVEKIAEGASIVKVAREARGYNLEELSVTSGLTIDEIITVENGDHIDAAKINRLAAALQLPESLRISFSNPDQG